MGIDSFLQNTVQTIDRLKAVGPLKQLDRFLPDHREQQVDALLGKIEHILQTEQGESNEERIKREQDILAQAAAAIDQTHASEKWVAKADQHDNGFKKGSRRPDEVRTDVINKLLDHAPNILRDTAYGDAFGGEQHYTKMSNERRKLFIRIAPDLIKTAQEKAGQLRNEAEHAGQPTESREKKIRADECESLVRHIQSELKNLVVGSVRSEQAGGESVDQAAVAEGMGTLVTIDQRLVLGEGATSAHVLEGFLLNQTVDAQHKAKEILQLKVNTLPDANRLLYAVSNAEKRLSDKELRVIEAAVLKLVHAGLPLNIRQDESVSFGGSYRAFEDQKGEQEKIYANYRSSVVNSLRGLTCGNDSKLRGVALSLAHQIEGR